tara:strand:+ start:1902 stop:2432 length:531 start_codon:yes stop_codon:yes gene_type:complete
MRIAITGHTSGIGKACFDMLGKEHEVVGYSRSNGWNIDDHNRLSLEIIDGNFDVLINNAYSGTSQVSILQTVFDAWKNKNKKIVSIGSIAADFLQRNTLFEDYTLNKRTLEDAHNRRVTDGTCQSILVKPAFTDTPMLKRAPKIVMTAQEVAEIVKYTIEQPETVYISELRVWPKK